MIYPIRKPHGFAQSIYVARQRGVATLVTAVILMLVVFSITYVISEVVIAEKQVVADEIRSKQAFQAAYAGMEYARVGAQDGVCSVVGECTGTVFGASYSVIASGSVSLVEVTSTGTSNDGSVQRVIKFAVGKVPGEATPPAIPIVARGGLGLTGNVKAINNESAITVWSGSDFTAGGSANTYVSVDGEDNQLSTIKATGQASAIYGPDVITNDGNLVLPKTSDSELLQAFFKKNSIEEFQTNPSGTIQTFAEMKDYNVGAKAYWSNEFTYYNDGDVSIGNSDVKTGTVDDESFEQLAEQKGGISGADLKQSFLDSANIAGTNLSFSNSAILGSPSDPVTIVVKGTLTLQSSPTIFGVIIADKIVMTGSPIIIGGMVVLDDGSDAVSGGGTPTVIMDKVIMGDAVNSDAYGTIKNSWKDW